MKRESQSKSTRTMEEIIATRISRRAALKGMLSVAAGGLLDLKRVIAIAGTPEKAVERRISTLTFEEIPNVIGIDHMVAPGYDTQALIRWGDRVTADAPEFDVYHQTAESQARQFGYNNDFIGYLPLPAGSQSSDHGLLCVNHEFTNPELMFPNCTKPAEVTKAQADVEIAAHGHSVIEVKRANGRWQVVADSVYNRRITGNHMPIRISGPAAGDDRLKTRADLTGTYVQGTLNNCTGGKTPWGTVLFAEENFHAYFGGDPTKTREARNHARYGLRRKSRYGWDQYYERFNVEKNPNEPNRFGWMVEFDPYDSHSMPVKRTALGRFKHEGATTILDDDGRIVVYSGDDERFDYLYKFVTHGRFDPNNRERNRNLLDSGTLFVARFDTDGMLAWLPLAWGTEPLTPDHGFNSQADVLIETRLAADLLGATPMDRPEEVEPNPYNGHVYAVFTNNDKRTPKKTDAANPRSPNSHGHILELIPPENPKRVADHAALKFRWEVFLLAGNPAIAGDQARYHEAVGQNGWLSSPDNVAIDKHGRLWIATDQGSEQSRNGIPDGLRATDVEGPGRALTRLFYACPTGAEMCGPEFTPDNTTLFVAVQHPGEDKGSTFASPSTRWPDFNDKMPPRPAVVAITKRDGGEIGS